jgi:hypothetical protein
MSIPIHIQEAIKTISINARMAMAIMCIEPILTHFQMETSSKNALVNVFWQFVENWDLASWDGNRYDNKDLAAVCEYFDYKEEIDKRLAISALPDFVQEMIYKMNTLGTVELYGKVESYSPLTHDFLIQILTIAVEHGFSFPPIEPFLKLPFSQQGGWGECVPRSFFIGHKDS